MFLDNAEFEGTIKYLAGYRDFGEIMGARLALQVLEVAVVRVELGKHVNDFIKRSRHSPSHIPVVKAALQAYRDKKRPKKEVLRDLRSFKRRFCLFLGEHAFPRTFRKPVLAS